jgi:hypothetical protein
MTDAGGDGSLPRMGSDETRLAALEAELAALRSELAELRGRVRRIEPLETPEPRARPAPPPRDTSAHFGDPATQARAQPHPSFTDRLEATARPGLNRSSLSGDAVESWVGRYGTLIAGAFVILLGVGTLVVWAVQRGLLSPEVRVGAGAVATACVAAAGLQFRRKGERRYGNVLLALSLAMTAVVAWGAGPRLHIIPSGVALAVVDLVALAIAALATQDDSEFLFAVAVAGALSAPFITSDQTGRPDVLLAYGTVVLLGGIRASSDPDWRRAPILLVAGAVLYELATAALPGVAEWYGPFLIPIFGGALALGALVFADSAWRGVLARSFLAVSLLGVLFGWDTIPGKPVVVVAVVSVALLATTYAALWVDHPPQKFWTASALLLPLLSLGVAETRAEGRAAPSAIFVGWGLVALAVWRAERWRARPERGSVHLLLATMFVAIGTAVWLWPNPLGLVSGLGGVALVASFLTRGEERDMPVIGPVLVLIGVGMSALDQLASLRPYAYTPFATRASASAFVALVAVAGVAVILSTARGAASRVVSRAHWVGATVAIAFIWGRMEVVHAFSRDASTFLLTLYYAATGVAGIVAGRRTDSKPFRMAGLVVAIYAGAKAVIEATNIDNLMLRVGCYAAVGAFLLGAGYLYRNTGMGDEAVGADEAVSGARAI